MNILYIDTSDSKQTIIGLQVDRKKDVLKKQSMKWKSQAVLPLIQTILKKKKIALSEIDEIHVNEGPGSFTGLRVGIAVANTLATILKIPINGKEIGEIAEPRYF